MDKPAALPAFPRRRRRVAPSRSGQTALFLVGGLAVAVFGLVFPGHVRPRRPDDDEVKQTARYTAYIRGSAAVAWAGLAGVAA